MENVVIPKQEMIKIVMDYLIFEGYQTAASAFANEANIEPSGDCNLLDERLRIRDAIFQGDLQSAIEEINDIDPELLDSNKGLHFALLRLQLIELIKNMFNGSEAEKPQLFGAAVTFAQQNLAPYTPQSDKYKSDLERAMALLIVPKEAWQSKSYSSASHSDHLSAFGPLSDLVHPSLKIDIVRDVNAAILRSLGRADYSSIHKMLQIRAWSQEQAREKRLDFGKSMNINLWDLPEEPQSANGNGGDTQMTEDTDESGSDPIQRYTNIESSR